MTQPVQSPVFNPASAENERLVALRQYGVLDSLPKKEYEDITE